MLLGFYTHFKEDIMTTKKSRRRTLTIIVSIAFILLLSFAISEPLHVNAASNAPYGYTYEDSATYKTVYKYYSWNETNYSLTKEFYSKSSAKSTTVYFSSGTVVSNNAVAGGAKFNGFDKEGNFYIITKDSALLKVSTTNKVTTLVDSGVNRLN